MLAVRRVGDDEDLNEPDGLVRYLMASADYTGYHLPQAVTDLAGRTTSFTYNADRQLETVTADDGSTMTLTYYPAGHQHHGRLHTLIDGSLTTPVLTLEYDQYGNPEIVTDAEGYTLFHEYDIAGRPTRTTYPDGTFTEVFYDRLDPVETVDRMGRVGRIFYNANRQVMAVRNPAGETTQFDWCTCGALETLVDPEGNITRWEYDVAGRVTAKFYNDGLGDRFNYLPLSGRLKEIVDAKGQVTSLEYLLDGALASVSWPDAPVPTPPVSYTYDEVFGRLATMTDGIGTTSYAYHPIAAPPVAWNGRLAAIDGPLVNDTLTFGYDAKGRVNSMLLDGVGTTYEFDELDRLAAVVNPLGRFENIYDGDLSRLLAVQSSTGHRTEFDYLGAQDDFALDAMRGLGPQGETLARFAYSYDTNGMITGISEEQLGVASQWNYAYDDSYRLIEAVKHKAGLTDVEAWQYDRMGNITASVKDRKVSQREYNGLNQLLGESGGGVAYASGSMGKAGTLEIDGQHVETNSDGDFRAWVEDVGADGELEFVATDPADRTTTSTVATNLLAADSKQSQ